MAALQRSCTRTHGSFTSYGVDADALDLQSLGQWELPVELGLHSLVVANVPTLQFTGTGLENL